MRLQAVVLSDKTRIGVEPPAIVRCPMAEAIVSWVREEAGPRAREFGAPLKSIENSGSFDCRGRNGDASAKLSEHGRANALDLRALKLANGKVLELTDPGVPKGFREGLRQSLCARFTTVLGPGSDGAHEDHIHIDLAERRGGYRICQWDVGEGGESAADTPALPKAAVDTPAKRSDGKRGRR